MLDRWSVAEAFRRNYGDEGTFTGTFAAMCEAVKSELLPQIKENADGEDIRLANYAAALVLRNMKMRESLENDGISAFRAGDVEIRQSGDMIKSVDSEVETKRLAALPLLADNGFAFRQVKT